MNDCIIRCNNLTKKYGSQLALNNLNLELPKGQIIGMLGPNGSTGVVPFLIKKI